MAPSASAVAASCTTGEQISQVPCATQPRQVDRLPNETQPVYVLSHCPVEDCGTGGCTYDVYANVQGCLRSVGSIHGAWIDLLPAGSSGWPAVRTWGRSGTTHIATDYELQSGHLISSRHFRCDYANPQSLSPDCPKL